MSSYVPLLKSRLLCRAAAMALLAGTVAGCSSGVERFGDPVYTGGTANQRTILGSEPRQPSYDEIAGNNSALPRASATRERTVASAPLPPVGTSANQPLRTGSIGGQRTSRIEQPAMPAALPQAAENSAPHSYGGWTSAGGTKVRLERGETISSAARRYGVPAKAIVAVNGIQDPSRVRAGSEIIIPTYVYNARRVTSGGVAPSATPVRTERVRVASTSTVVPDAKPARKRRARSVSQERPGRDSESHRRTSNSHAPITASQPPRKPDIGPRVARDVARAEPVERHQDTPRAEPRKREPDITASINAEPVSAPAQNADRGDTRFRWPVRGRVISSFGSKPGGTRNDGINLAVPEGTAVRAVESGTVIYSGNELKGYGNLVLIRHKDGWVSAYAHNSELDVRRGDTVRRGQVVAKAGSSGAVNRPQLHFELRRGNRPVDPVQFLPKAS